MMILGVFAILLASGWIIPETRHPVAVSPYCYPRAAVKQAKAVAVKQLVRLGFWPSGFV